MSPDYKIDEFIETLRQRIKEREFGTAGRLPSLRMLAEEFGTTHETMNKVIQQLQAEGLLYSRGRAGVFVTSPRKPVPGITQRFDTFLESQGLTAIEVNVAEPSIVPAPAEVAMIFDIPEEAPVVRRFRRQGTPTTPYRLAENYYPVDLAGGEILEAMQQDVKFDVLDAIKKAHQQVIRSVYEDVYARFPTPPEQEALNILRNTPVFEIQRTSYAAEEDGPIIMYSRIICVASLFVLSYTYTTDLWLGK